jgi:hypothetical protein
MKYLMISKRGEQVIKTGFISSKKGARLAQDRRDNEYGGYLSHFIKMPNGELKNVFSFFLDLNKGGSNE